MRLQLAQLNTSIFKNIPIWARLQLIILNLELPTAVAIEAVTQTLNIPGERRDGALLIITEDAMSWKMRRFMAGP